MGAILSVEKINKSYNENLLSKLIVVTLTDSFYSYKQEGRLLACRKVTESKPKILELAPQIFHQSTGGRKGSTT